MVGGEGCGWQGRLNPTAYTGRPRLGTAVSLLSVTDTIGANLHEVGVNRRDTGTGVNGLLNLLT